VTQCVSGEHFSILAYLVEFQLPDKSIEQSIDHIALPDTDFNLRVLAPELSLGE
jgi:hypothetical protein